MKNCWSKIIPLLLLPGFSVAQLLNVDSLAREANRTNNDTIKLVQLRTVARIYAELNPDTSFYYSERSLELARKLHLKIEEGSALREIGYAYLNKSNYPRSLQTLLSALSILEDPAIESRALVGKYPGDDAMMDHTASPHAQRLSQISFTQQILGILYANSNNYLKSWHHHLLARQFSEESGNIPVLSVSNLTLNRVYLNLQKNDSALYSIQQAYAQAMQSGFKRYLGSVLLNMGKTYAVLGDTTKANEYYRQSLKASVDQGYFRGLVASSLLLGEYYNERGKTDSAFRYINDALSTSQSLDAPDLLLRSYTALTHYYSKVGNNDSIVKYQALIIQINNSLFNAKQAQEFQNIDFEDQQRKLEVEEAQKALRNKWRMYAMLGGLSLFLFIVILQWRNSLQRRKANQLLSKQKAELETALSSLKATQGQLIQAEKMASLGELMSGIAHEIQNPLNFVNNFSEVNKELVEELKMKNEKLKIDDKDLKSLIGDIEQNLEKINHHGKRADSIVKGMLQHTGASSGQKSPTDINALSDECLRLAYRGIRAKDISFNANIETDFDGNIGTVNVVSQDIGRVILNLINNAFYAVNEKQNAKRLTQDAESYEPGVIVGTKKEKDKVEIFVKDNGNGISDAIKEKIFQPFFTTKPTGQGTGLGLSLSYDIVKAHDGVIKVESISNESTTFTVLLPVS